MLDISVDRPAALYVVYETHPHCHSMTKKLYAVQLFDEVSWT